MANFAFIHGAGDVGWYWHLVEAELRLRGHDTVAPDLPIEDDTAGLAEYATAVIDAIGDRQDVVVVAQSFGGYVAPIVAERIDARLIVLVAAMVPSPGESAEEMFVNTRWEPDAARRLQRARSLLPRRPARNSPTRPSVAAGVNRTPRAGSPGRSRRGPISRPASSSAGTTASSPQPGCEKWFGSVSASSPPRSTAATARH